MCLPNAQQPVESVMDAGVVSVSDDSAWTVEEAARFLGIAPKTLYRWASEGLVPSVKMGNLRRFSPRALAAWREGRTHGGR
ncbi:hypothetical protein CYFUS_006582 [Cystobacter fuscus]|uniref:Helix-turn-helix domain-containing protein n=1 Tax=Cystobacter fuscus TaxID=43 RepID=A0A250JC06_9BACT|nr:hypothetical protein CYFUS_006582 [Cystobacter fuscus]